MTTQELRTQIENLSKEMNISFIDACSAMQAAAAKKGNEEIITEIHKMKMKAAGIEL